MPLRRGGKKTNRQGAKDAKKAGRGVHRRGAESAEKGTQRIRQVKESKGASFCYLLNLSALFLCVLCASAVNSLLLGASSLASLAPWRFVSAFSSVLVFGWFSSDR